MEIKPMFETGTFEIINVTNVKANPIKSNKLKDPEGIIPSAMFRIINWEKKRQLFILGINLIIFLLALSMTLVYSFHVYNVIWLAYSIPAIMGVWSISRVSLMWLERSALNRSVDRYRENLKSGLQSVPPFIPKLYKSLHLNQVKHNWLTFSFIFYVGLLTLLLWSLKNFSWWIFDFETWINSLFHNPNLMVMMLTTSLILVSLFHIIFAIERKKKVIEIDSFFGESLIPMSDLELMKMEKNKAYRRIFVISVMIVLVIPMIVKWTIKILRKRK